MKASPGSVNTTVCCAGADREARMKKESAIRAALETGVLGLDHNNLRPILERLNVIDVRRAEDLPTA